MDAAFGAPATAEASAGAVAIVYGPLDQPALESDRFTADDLVGLGESLRDIGASLAAGDFDGDGKTDLAIGAPHSSVPASARGGSVSAGMVFVLYGSDLGLTTSGLH